MLEHIKSEDYFLGVTLALPSLPSNSKIIGNPGHTSDHDLITTALQGAVYGVNNGQDFSDAGATRGNIGVSVLTPAACVATVNVPTMSGPGGATTIASGSNTLTLPQATLNVVATSSLPLSGTANVITSVGTSIVLSSALSTSVPITAIPVTSLSLSVAAGTITLTSGGNSQSFLTTGALTGATSIPVTSTIPTFAFSTGTIFAVPQAVTYTGVTSTTLTGCSGGTGTMSTGGAVTATFDGYLLAATDTILLTGQTTASQNGPWLIPAGVSGAWTRPTEFNSSLANPVHGRTIRVLNGTNYGNTEWTLVAGTGGLTVDTGNQTWTQAFYASPNRASNLILYVDPTNGSDSNRGLSWGQPLQHLQTAIDTLYALGGGVAKCTAGTYTEIITLRATVAVEGPHSTLMEIVGPVGSTSPGVIVLDAGVVVGAHCKGFSVNTSVSGQGGIYLAASGTTGGLQYTDFDDVRVGQCPSDSWAFYGGGSSDLLPHQFNNFYRCFGLASTTGAALRLSGQCGQFEFYGGQWDGPSQASPGSVANLVMLANGGSYPYAITFHGTTHQNNHQAVSITGCEDIHFEGTYLENIDRSFTISGSSKININRPHFANAGSDYNADGLGYLVSQSSSRVVVNSPSVYGAVDTAWINDSALGFLTVRDAYYPSSITAPATTDLTRLVSIASDGSISIDGIQTVLVNGGSAYNLTKFNTFRSVGEIITIRAFGGTVVLASGGNLSLSGNASPLTLQTNQSATFVKFDQSIVWDLIAVSIAPATPGAWNVVSGFTNSWTSVGGSSAAVAYRLSADGVHVELAGILGSGTPSNAAFTLPTGYRPMTAKTVSSYSTGTGGGRYVSISSAGAVTPQPSGATAPFSLDGITFPLDI